MTAVTEAEVDRLAGLSADERVRSVAARLAEGGVPGAHADARWLVADAADARQLAGWVARRLAREPLQLILGVAAFRTLDLRCDPGVFIPRPETEVVAGVAIDAARAAGPAPLVLEPCTGGGAITTALLAEVPGCHVEATDLNPRALELAAHNLAAAAAVGDGSTYRLHRGHLLDPVDAALRGTVDVLVANPPYLPARDATTWEREVADHDPLEALIGGTDGNELVAELLAAAPLWLRPGGTVVVEHDERRGEELLALAAAAGLVEARIGTDLTGRPRYLSARRGWHAA